MGVSLIFSLFLLFLSTSTASSACDQCVHHSNAAYFRRSSALPAGSCGYGSTALELNGGYIAAASPSIYRDGVGCGACFHVRCKNTALCSSRGIKVVVVSCVRKRVRFLFGPTVVTDQTKSNRTDFVLSRKAFAAMGQNSRSAGELLRNKMAEVEYKRIPCEYSRNMSVMVEEGSIWPRNLKMKILYQGRQTDILAGDVGQVESPNWQFLSRDFGAVWSTSMAPQGPIQLRVVVIGGFDAHYVYALGPVLPVDWKVGEVYGSGVQITDVAQDGCSPCDDDEWK